MREVETREKMEKLAGELEAANKDLKKLDQAKSDFISIASHQLRTPLTVVKGYISMMREGTFGKLDDKLRSALDKVYISNERLINLVNDLLDLSRMERGKLQFDFKVMHLLPVVEGLAQDFEIAAKQKGLKFTFHKTKLNDAVYGDENKLRQVVLNIIDNAVKYTPEGSIDVYLEEVGDKIRFSVRDTGAGLSPDETHSLFQKFVRGKAERKSHTEGLGLGLHVAKLIVDAHGGELTAESQGKYHGSTFSMTLPRYR